MAICSVANRQGWRKKVTLAPAPMGPGPEGKVNSESVSAYEKTIKELQVKIVTLLNLIDVQPDDIKADDQLVGGNIGIDSIDVLEMGIMIEKDYGVRIDNRELGIKVFASLRTLAEYIYEQSSRSI